MNEGTFIVSCIASLLEEKLYFVHNVIHLQSHPLSTATEMKLFGGLNYFLGAKLLIQWKTSQTF